MNRYYSNRDFLGNRLLYLNLPLECFTLLLPNNLWPSILQDQHPQLPSTPTQSLNLFLFSRYTGPPRTTEIVPFWFNFFLYQYHYKKKSFNLVAPAQAHNLLAAAQTFPLSAKYTENLTSFKHFWLYFFVALNLWCTYEWSSNEKLMVRVSINQFLTTLKYLSISADDNVAFSKFMRCPLPKHEHIMVNPTLYGEKKIKNMQLHRCYILTRIKKKQRVF